MTPRSWLSRHAAILTALLAWPFAGPAKADDFRDAVAPILETRCVRCHREGEAKGKLSLATLRDATKGGLSGPAIVPGKPDASWLLDMVAGDEPSMPKGGSPLSPDEVATLRRWIEEGANWPEEMTLAQKTPDQGPWWAITPLERPDIPSPAGAGPIRNPIDAFLLDTLNAKGLRYRSEADRRTLIRRLTFDLHGLPPSPGEVGAFLEDTSPDAYERLVDRLLASPAYGERWARHWLDVAHYGDTHGYDKDKRRDHAWPYRDWVIRAFNSDLPYAEFIRMQLAGDVLRPGDPDGVVATGFIAAGPWDFVGHVELREGTVEKAKTRLVDRDDMLTNAMSTFTSLTVHCARCHDHKFDPIPQRDYYALQAVFAGVDRGDRPYRSPEAAAARRSFVAVRDDAAARLGKLRRRVDDAVGPEVAAIDRELERLRADLEDLPRHQAVGSSPSNGYHSAIHAEQVNTAWVQVDLGRPVPIDEVRLVPARPTDFPDTPGFGFPPEYRIEASDDPGFAGSTVLHVESREEDADLPDEAVVIRPEGIRARFVRVTATRLWKRLDDYVFAMAELEVVSRGRNVALGSRVIGLDSIEAGRWSARFLVDGHSSRAPRPTEGDVEASRRHDLLAKLDALRCERSELAKGRVDPALRAEVEEAARQLDEAERRLAAEPATRLVYAVTPKEPSPIHVLRRGEVEQPGEMATPGAIACVPGIDADFSETIGRPESARRAALAEWIASRENMLTWRSMANRAWQYHFGRGLVATPSDFGRNGGEPSHPELLDWLAVELRDGGGSPKHLHRLIVTSAAYRQSSEHDPEAAAIDGENRLLWRQNRRRLEAEEVRDAALAVSGTLERRMGGPGFEVFRFKDDHSPIYDHLDPAAILNAEGNRRAVYRFIVRSVPNPFLDCLDGADPNAPTPARNETITAPQALTLLNDPFMLARAEDLASRLRGEAMGTPGRIDRAFGLALGRPPTGAERAALVGFADRQGLARACRLLFNLNEFVFVD